LSRRKQRASLAADPEVTALLCQPSRFVDRVLERASDEHAVGAEDPASHLGELLRGHGAESAVLGHHDLGEHRLEGRQHPLVVLVLHHADDTDQRRERERVLQCFTVAAAPCGLCAASSTIVGLHADFYREV